MNLIVTCPVFPPAVLGGGPIRTLSAMLEQADDRHHAKVLTNNYDMGRRDLLVPPGNTWEPFGSNEVLYVNPDPVSWIRGLRTALSVRPDAYYLNGLFNARLSIAMQILTQAQRTSTVSIAPRGELDPGALNLKSDKKSLFLKVAKSSGILNGVIWHASSEQEAENIRRVFGDQARVLIREDDTMLPSTAALPSEHIHRELKTVFVSRISAKKGLDVALKALAYVKHPIAFDVIGPEEDAEYVRECRRLAEKLPSHVKVKFQGPVDPEKVRDAITPYDLMIFPTAGENFGHVIGEALSVSLPLMITDTTPWSARVDAGGGQVIEGRDPFGWGVAIDEYAKLTPHSWHRRRELAGRSYNKWMASQSAEHFFDLLECEVS